MIESYASAVRRFDDEHRKVIAEVRSAICKLEEGASVVDEFKVEIVTKLSAVKREMRAKINENKDVEATLTEHLESMTELERKPLNAKTW